MPIFQTQNVSRWFMAEACSACVDYVHPHILFGVNLEEWLLCLRVKMGISLVKAMCALCGNRTKRINQRVWFEDVGAINLLQVLPNSKLLYTFAAKLNDYGIFS